MKSYNWRDICGFAAVQVVSPAESLQYFTFPRMGAVCVIPPVFRLQPWSPRAASTWRRASMNPLLFPAGPVCLGSASQQRSFRASVPASGQASSAGSSNHTTTCTQQDKQCRPSSDPLVAFHVVGSRWTGQSQKQQNIKYVFISAMKMTMKRQPLRKSQSDCLLFGVEGFVLCNLWQEGEGTREKKKKGSELLQLQFVTHWKVIGFGLLTAAACWQLWAYPGLISMLRFSCKANINKLESLTWVNSIRVFSPAEILNFLWLWNGGRRNWTQRMKNSE